MTQDGSKHLEKLKFVAQDFNPFVAEISEEMLLILKELELEEFLDNPFTLSNEILKRLHEHDFLKAKEEKKLQ